MNEESFLDPAAYADLERKKEEELMNTIKMEPIIETTIIDEDPSIIQKEKKMRVTDIFLIILIALLSALFLVVVFKVR